MIKYGEDKYFIGAIKFFDKNKDFGYIASNNCGMPDMQEYTQDFYINSSSFVDRIPLLDEAIVVFQIEKQKRERLRAINVRRITSSKEDIIVAENYFGDHENVFLKNNSEFNLFKSSNKYLIGVATSHLLYIIKNDEKREPNITFEHFNKFINNYRTQSKGNHVLYVFDIDFETEDKKVWKNFFSSLTSDEILKILNEYPSVLKYIEDQESIMKWIDCIEQQELSIGTLQILNSNLQFIQGSESNKLKGIIDKNALRIADMIEKRYTSEATLHNELLPLKQFSVINVNDIIERFKHNQLLKDFQTNLNDFKASRYNSTEKLKKSYNNLPDDCKADHLKQIEKVIKDKTNALIKSNTGTQAFYFIEIFDFLSTDLVLNLKQKLFIPAKENVLNKIEGALKDVRIVESLFAAYALLKRNYESTSFTDVTDSIKNKILRSESLYVLNKLLNYDLISRESILQRAVDIINNWDFKKIKDYLKPGHKPFEEEDIIKETIINHAIELIYPYNLSEPFDGTQLEDPHSTYYKYTQAENCSFLSNLQYYKGYKNNKKFNDYINSRTSKDKIYLYQHEVIKELDEKVLQELVNGITIDDAYAKSKRWYNPPAIKDDVLKKALKESSLNLFEIIGNRIAEIDVIPDNIPLIVFLLEIMSINKPNYPDYYEKRDWDEKVRTGINKIVNNNSSNTKLKTVLWAVYFQNTASFTQLKELFTYFPPYIQIKAVKKLFQLISQGRLNKKSDELYSLLGGNERPLCFPLEITFEYLKVRSENPSATLDNNIMLRLLDGREDHNEWIGIRQLLHNCKGRWYVEDQDEQGDYWRRNRFYNGFAKRTEKEIVVVVPRKMCDSNGEPQNYNNTYYNQIQQYISLHFEPNVYTHYKIDNSEVFKFSYNDVNHIEILNLARTYNIRYDTYKNSIQFECNTNDEQPFCETRNALKLDDWNHLPFYWCASKPCLRPPVRYRLDDEWEDYTILDFMRIMKIPVDYIKNNGTGNTTKFGHYIILNSFLLSFNKFYEHLKCRECGQLMKPLTNVTNFHTRAVNEFKCADPDCKGVNEIVYLNHCFNSKNCNATIDSRDSKRCPNNQYICHECGACCSTKNFEIRLNNLRINGGYISPGLERFVNLKLGHWEKQIFYCYKCGSQMENGECLKCHIKYEN